VKLARESGVKITPELPDSFVTGEQENQLYNQRLKVLYIEIDRERRNRAKSDYRQYGTHWKEFLM
jgi:hypothetical protein